MSVDGCWWNVVSDVRDHALLSFVFQCEWSFREFVFRLYDLGIANSFGYIVLFHWLGSFYRAE